MTTYYVATNGSDSNNGTTTGTPFATIQKAANVVAAGDTVLVRGGTYNQIFTLSKSGTSGNEITFDAYPGSGTRETVIIDGKMQLPTGSWYPGSTGSTPYGTLLGYVWIPMVRISGNYITLRNMSILNGRGVGVWVMNAKNSNVESDFNHHITLEDLVIGNHRRQTLRIALCTDVTCTRVEVYLNGTFAPFTRPSSVGPWSGALRANNARRVEFIDCVCRENWGEGIDVAKCDDVLIQGCIAYDNWRMNLYINLATNVVAENCLLYHSGASNFTISGNYPPNIYLQNEIRDSDRFGPLDSIVIRNCIAIGGGNNFMMGDAQGSTSTMTNVKIYNNTFVNARNYAYWMNGQTNLTYSNFYIRNNIFYQPSAVLDVGGGWADDITFNNNLWWDGSGGLPHANLRDGGDVYADPGLVRPNAPLVAGAVDAAWYKLSSTDSPAKDAGYNVGADVTDDYFGGTRSTHDIGAHEYGATTPSGTITADFSADVTSGTGSLTVQFSDDSTSTSGITAWTWRARRDSGAWFTFSTSQNPIYTLSSGTYDIQLVVSGPDGNSDRTRYSYIVVTAAGDESGGSSGETATTGNKYYSVVRVAASTSSGTQQIDLPDDITPTALLFWLSYATTDGTAADHAVCAFGAWDSAGNQWSVSVSAEDNQGTTDTTRYITNAAAILIVQPGEQTPDAIATVDSVGVGSVTLNWSDGAGGAYLLTVVAIECDNAYAGAIATDSTVGNTSATTDPGFEPTVIIAAHTERAGPVGSNDYARTGMGWAVNGGNQCAVAIEWNNAAATATGNSVVADDRIAIASGNSSQAWGAEVTSFDATGFTITTRDGNTYGSYLAYLALDLGDYGAWAGVIDTPTSTGAQAYTAPSMRAGAVLIAPSMAEAVATGYTDARGGVYGLIASSIDLTYTNVISNDMSADPSDTKSFADNAVTVPLDDGSAGVAGGGITPNSDGFGVTFTTVTATAKKWPALVLGAPAELQDDWFQFTLRKTLRVGLP